MRVKKPTQTQMFLLRQLADYAMKENWDIPDSLTHFKGKLKNSMDSLLYNELVETYDHPKYKPPYWEPVRLTKLGWQTLARYDHHYAEHAEKILHPRKAAKKAKERAEREAQKSLDEGIEAS